jgi:glyoxylase I family protein
VDIQFRLDHIAVQSADFEKSFLFYSETLGLRVTKQPFRFKTRMVAWLDAGIVQIELTSMKDGDERVPFSSRGVGPSHLAFAVPDLAAALAAIGEQGVEVVKPPFVPPTGDPDQPTIAFIRGPEGEEIEIRESL